LTEGKPRLVDVAAVGGVPANELLRLVASLERGSEHPLAAAITWGAEERKLALGDAADFQSQTGKSVTGTIDGKRVAVGNLALFAALGVDPCNLPKEAEARRYQGQTVMLVPVDGSAAGLVAVADPIKESAIGAIAALKADRIRVVMLTGDSRTTAMAVARKLGINDVVAEVLPDQKAAAVKKFQDEGRFGAMAGDDINDAPALAQAQVGIAMGASADVAMESAAVTLIVSCVRAISTGRRWPTSGRICSLPSSSTRCRCRSRPACSTPGSGFCLIR
jgi:P-type Cu+ transporter